MTGGTVPIVPAAVIFDLPVGAWSNRPDAEFGYWAAAAAGIDVAMGCGRGAGARAGVLKDGVGTASTVLDSGVTVGAIVVVNSAGEVLDTATGLPWMADLARDFGLTEPTAEQIASYAALHGEKSPLNTTIAVVATDAVLSPPDADGWPSPPRTGLARAIRPVHTPLDGDYVFALATGAVEVEPDPDTPIAMLPDTALVTAVRRGRRRLPWPGPSWPVLAAERWPGLPTLQQMFPGRGVSYERDRTAAHQVAGLEDRRRDHPCPSSCCST